MIQIVDKHNCCGCAACAQNCPKHCISMNEDEEGFLYPHVNTSVCIDCNLCEKVCPVINQSATRKPIACYAAKNPNEEIRVKSSSGGVFFSIASNIINEGGIVFGASYNKQWEVIHASASIIEGLHAFQGSKYAQSRIGKIFLEIKKNIEDGRKILFSGTPCQVSALKKLIHSENLITVDFICHGVPSPKVWRDYVSQLPMENITEIRMKDKSTGWRGYSFSLFNSKGDIEFREKASSNKYMIAFFRNLTIRPSCFKCPAKAGKSQSDITLADFWGIEKFHPTMDDDKGINLICCNTVKGLALINSLGLQLNKTDYDTAIVYNSCMIKSTQEPLSRVSFWKNYQNRGIETLLSLETKVNIFLRIRQRLFRSCHLNNPLFCHKKD